MPKLNKDSDPSPTAQDSNNNNNNNNNGRGKKIIMDARFVSVHSDPRFQKFPRHKSKVTIDSRFDRMFKELVVSWHMKAATICEFSKQEFIGGLQGLGIDSLEKFCEKIPFMCMELKDDRLYKCS
ncbi:hypothetical protein SO802_030002 [Lithocarpus litseifolius]|uniref:Uncharacterized protein n=1 Tax=Lithocarpus litseifolius TaxID=425828 RepID=A0AAW2BWW7_9ROSI